MEAEPRLCNLPNDNQTAGVTDLPSQQHRWRLNHTISVALGKKGTFKRKTGTFCGSSTMNGPFPDGPGPPVDPWNLCLVDLNTQIIESHRLEVSLLAPQTAPPRLRDAVAQSAEVRKTVPEFQDFTR